MNEPGLHPSEAVMGILPRFPAAVAELADALDSGSSGSNIPWRFDSSQPHVSAGSELGARCFCMAD